MPIHTDAPAAMTTTLHAAFSPPAHAVPQQLVSHLEPHEVASPTRLLYVSSAASPVLPHVVNQTALLQLDLDALSGLV